MLKLNLFKKKIFLRCCAALLSAVLMLPTLAACGGQKDESEKKTTLTIMSWNDDFRNMMDTYFVPLHQELMKNVEIKWISNEIVNYANDVEERLDKGETIDIFLGNDDMAPRFVNNDKVAYLSELGIETSETSEQYNYTRVLASDANGMQKGSAFTAEPGIIIYRTDYAQQYLGITNQEEMQKRLSSWDTFLSTAQTLKEKSDGKIKMVTNSSEVWMPIDAAMTGLWTTDEKLDVSEETVNRWLNYIDDLGDCGAYRSSNVMSDDWYNAVSSGVFCFFTAPWLNKNVSSTTAETDTIFYAAQKGGKSMGKWKTALAPNSFSYGGCWLYSSANSQNKELAGEIIKEFTCNSEFMKLIALGNMEYVNNVRAIEELSELNINNPLFDGQDAFSVYHQAAKELEISTPSIYDADISKLLYNQAVKYKNKKITAQEAVYNFHYNVWKKFENITQKPEPIDENVEK